MVHFALLSGVQAFLAFVFYVGVLVFVLTRRTRLGPQAARLALWGASLLMGGWIFSASWPLMFGMYSRGFSAGSEVATVAAVLSFVSTAAHLAGIALLVMAAFAERPAAAPGYTAPAAPGAIPAPGGVPPWADPEGPDRG